MITIFFFQAEDGIRDGHVTGVQTCALPISAGCGSGGSDVPEVPGPPAELTVPHVKGAADLAEDAGATPTPTPSADATETPTPATGTTGSTGTTGTTGTGGTTAATP